MKYVNEQFNFSITLLSGWVQSHLLPTFTATGGKAAFSHPAGATLNISAACRGVIPDRNKRERSLLLFLRMTALLRMNLRARAYPTGQVLSCEPNTAWGEIRIGERVHGLVEAVHDGKAYTIQYMHDPDRERDIKEILASFEFTR